MSSKGLPWWLSGKESVCNAGDTGSNPWAGKIPWRGKWHPTPVFLPGKSQRQRSLAWGHKRVRHDLVTEHTHPYVLKELCTW